MDYLLAVDLGVRTGLAFFSYEPSLIWYRSHNYGSKARLRKHIYSILKDIPPSSELLIEGGGDIASVWKKGADKCGIAYEQIYAEDWRPDILKPSSIKNAELAKAAADRAAQIAIKLYNAPKKYTIPNTDASEAILIGLWGLFKRGAVQSIPPEIKG